MPVVKLPFPGALDKNLLDTIVKQGSVEIWNGYLDATGAIYKRPGLTLNQTIDTILFGVKGLYWWESKRRFVLIGDGNLFSAFSLVDNFVQISSGLDILQDGLVQFADTGEWLYVASTAGKLMTWNGADAPTLDPDPGAPTNVSSVVFFKGRVYAAVKGTNRIWYTNGIASTDPGLQLAWEGFIDVRRTGDPIIALQDKGADLVVFKNSTTETYYYDDTIESIRPVEGSLQEVGLMSSRAFKLISGILFFVTNKQQVAKIENQSIQVISAWMDSFLQGLTSTSDAYLVQVDKFLLVQFPTVDQTIVFDLQNQSWYRWSDFSQNKHRMFAVNCSTYQPGGASQWILGNANGTTYFLDPQSFTDDGTLIRFSVQSLHYDHNTHNKKLAIRMTAKVALDFPGKPVLKPLTPDPVTRCSAYSFTFPDYEREGYTISVVGLPAGLTYDGTTRTISGIVPCQKGDFPIGVYMIDERGARYRFSRILTVNDFDITLTFS